MTTSVELSLMVFGPGDELLAGLSRTVAEPPAFLPRAGETMDLFADSPVDDVRGPDGGHRMARVDAVAWEPTLTRTTVHLVLEVDALFASEPWLRTLLSLGWYPWPTDGA